MPARRRASIPLIFSPRTVSDAIDGTPVARGAMAELSNLVPDPATDRIFVCRPAAQQLTSFPGFTNPGAVSALLVVGDIAYGMIASDRNPGTDEPFAYNLASDTFLPVSGITAIAGNCPATQPASGDWTPPIMAAVGSRIIVCHPGFPGGTKKFGWFDLSGLNLTITGNVASGSAVITGNPAIAALQPGLALAGTGINTAATVVATAPFTLTTTGNTHSNTTLDGLASTVGVAVGQIVTGSGIPAGTTVASVSGSTVTLSQAATATASGVSVTFTGATVTMSHNGTATNNSVAITVTGGTRTAPQWGSGDCDRNPLVSVPVAVAQFYGRAYFALGVDGIVFSDAGFPCRVSNATAVQALASNDGLAITALAPLGLSTLTGGVVKALIAFAGITKMYQITGDQSLANLAIDDIQAAPGSGTVAPLSIVPIEQGIAYVSNYGLRLIDLRGVVSPVIGHSGAGVSVPFAQALYPSRICAAANTGQLRISTQRGDQSGTPYQEFWYDLSRFVWTGPHSWPATLIQPWRDTFVMASVFAPASLWRSDARPSASSTFTEAGYGLSWRYRPAPLPDTGAMAENALTEMTLAMTAAANLSLGAIAADINGQTLDAITIDFSSGSLWGHMIWGVSPWGGGGIYQQVAINWKVPLVFKQLSLTFQGQSSANFRIGNLYMRYEILGYTLQ